MSPRLFTKSDVERAARLATLHKLVDADPEVAVQKAVSSVCEDGPVYFSEGEVKQMLQYALNVDDVETAFEEALSALRKV